MYRRSVLSSLAMGSVYALAGCLVGGCGSGTGLSLVPVDANDVAREHADTDLEQTSEMAGEFLTRALDGEEPAVEAIERASLGVPTYLEHDGRFYEIEVETLETGRVTGPEYRLGRDRETDERVSPDEALSFEDLPHHDQLRVAQALESLTDRLETASFSTWLIAGYLDPADQAESVLAAGVDASAIEIDGHFVELEQGEEQTVTAHRFRISADPVAADTDAFAGYVLGDRGAELSDPSDDVRALLDDALANGGSVDVCDRATDDVDEETAQRRREAIDKLDEWLESAPARDGERSHPVEYVRYEGEWYHVSISSWAV